MRAILLIDHGSRRAESNEQLEQVAQMVAGLAGDGALVVASHMELAEPDVAAGFTECVRRGATEVVAVPYLLARGRHATEDIPRLVREAATAHPGVTFRVADALGVHPGLGAVVLERVAQAESVGPATEPGDSRGLGKA